MPTVLTVSRLPQPQREAPAMVTVIDRKMIEASGFSNIPDLLRLVPGFQVTYISGWQPVVTYHGMSDGWSRRLQVLVDGRSIFNPSFGQVDWRELPLAMEDIERIEVIHGPSAPAYGSNAFLATINIMTLHGGEDPGGQFAVSRGNHDIARYALRHSARQGDLAYRVSLVDRRDRRFPINPDEAHDLFLNARLDYQLNERDDLMAQLGLSRSEWDIGLPGNTLDPPRAADNANHFLQLRWQRKLGEGREYSLQYSRSQKEFESAWSIVGADVLIHPLLPHVIPADYDHTVLREQLEFQATRPLSDRTRAVYGAEIRRDEVQSRHFFYPGDTYSETLYRLFGTLEWRPHPEWLFNAGGMLERHYYAGTTFSPRLSLHYLPSQRHAFRAGLSRGYRSETFLEQVGDERYLTPAGTTLNQRIRPAGPLEPERVDSAELGYVGRYPEHGLSLNLRLFHDRFKRLIGEIDFDTSTAFTYPPDIDIDGFAWQSTNRFNMKMWGGEYQLQWQPDGTTRIILGQSWVWQDAHDYLGPGSSDEDELNRSVPRMSLSLLASKDLGAGLTASLGYYRVGRMLWLGGGQAVDRYGRVDARLAKAWHSGDSSYELALVLQNLAGPYQDFENGPHRTFEAHQAFVTFRLWH